MAKKSAKKKVTKRAAAKKSAKTASKKPAAKAKKTAKGGEVYKFRVGDRVPTTQLPSTIGAPRSLKELEGRLAVIYFYPKDNTPGCTLEGQDFRRLYKDFRGVGCEIFGVSRDSIKSHLGFKEKCDFPFELLADEDGALCKAFDVIQMKSLYGRKFIGIERSTFVVGPDGKVLKEWRKVKVNGHADEVLEFVKAQKT